MTSTPENATPAKARSNWRPSPMLMILLIIAALMAVVAAFVVFVIGPMVDNRNAEASARADDYLAEVKAKYYLDSIEIHFEDADDSLLRVMEDNEGETMRFDNVEVVEVLTIDGMRRPDCRLIDRFEDPTLECENGRP